MVIFCCAPKDFQAELQPTLRKDPQSPVAMESPASGQKKKERKKRGISWKREPPEVALVSQRLVLCREPIYPRLNYLM